MDLGICGVYPLWIPKSTDISGTNLKGAKIWGGARNLQDLKVCLLSLKVAVETEKRRGLAAQREETQCGALF